MKPGFEDHLALDSELSNHTCAAGVTSGTATEVMQKGGLMEL